MPIVTLALLVTTLQAAPTVQDVKWLTGCWEFTRGGRHVIEQWSAPEGGTLIGMSRTVANGKTVEFEFLMIREGAGGLEYVARPSGQAEGTFTSTRVADGEVAFENPTHDFPTRIIYQRAPDGGLVAATEGTRNGQARRFEFPYTKATCGH